MRSDDLTAAEIERYAAGELTADEAAAAAEHLRSCGRCAAAVLDVIQMKRAVRDAVPRFTPSSALRDRVTRSIAPSPARRSNTAWWMAAAAALLFGLLLLGTFVGRAVSTAREFADLHATLLAGANPVEVLSTDKHTVKPWFEGRVPFAVPVPELNGSAFHLIGGRTVFLRSATGAYLLVGKGAHRISVFVFPSDAVPPVGRIPSVSIVSWRSHGLVFIAVGDVPAADLQSLRRMFDRS